jgi:hypothetical protein
MRVVLAAFLCLLVAAPAASAGLPRGFVGLYGDDAFFGDSSYRADQFAAEARAGVATVRQPIDWWRVETSPGKFDFSAYDTFVEDAARAGLQVLPILAGPPSFHSSRPADSPSRAMFPPNSNAAYATFVRAAVRRYGANGSFWSSHPDLPFVPMRSWQIWNEPNIPNFWRSGVNAKQYVDLLRAGSAAVRSVDPHDEVVAAGLPNSQLGVPFLSYLDQMYRAGAKGLFNTLAIHPYSRTVQGLLDLAEQARIVMNKWHDRSHLWITEFGWSTGGDASAFRVTENGQAQRISAALSGLIAQRRALRLRGFVLFKWKDSVAPAEMAGDPWPLHTGLLDSDGAPKAGFWSFGRIIRAWRSPEPWPQGSATLARISTRTVRLSPLGYAAVSLGCRSEETGACAGTLRLQSAKPITCGDVTFDAGTPLGTAQFHIAIAPAIAPVRLSPGARRAALCAGRIRVRASVSSGRAQASAARAVEFDLRAR